MGIVLGVIHVILLFVAGWWISIPFVSESSIFTWALAGLLSGLLIDLLFLRRWMRRAFSSKS
ncbi:MAG TPA: hypothetical protein PKI17_00845 [Syntrophomonas sp.]|nr:hypothetical protein [Syntrophomonas sp.]